MVTRGASSAQLFGERAPSVFANLLLQPLDIRAQSRYSAGNGYFVSKKNRPYSDPCGKEEMEIFHMESFAEDAIRADGEPESRASAATRNSSNSWRSRSSRYRSTSARIATNSIAAIQITSTLPIVGLRPASGPPKITGAGCCVRHSRFDAYTKGASRKAKMPKTAESVARRCGSSINPRSSK